MLYCCNFFSQCMPLLWLFVAFSLFLALPLPSLRSLLKIRVIYFLVVSRFNVGTQSTLYLCQALATCPETDLPTPVTCKSGGFENKSRKTWRLGPQTWRFSKYVSNNKKSIICLRVFLFYLFSAPCCTLWQLFWQR